MKAILCIRIIPSTYAANKHHFTNTETSYVNMYVHSYSIGPMKKTKNPRVTV